MPYRFLPNSDAQRTKALNTAHTRWLGTTADKRLITAEHFAKLDETNGNCLRRVWLREVNEADTALGAQVSLTRDLDTAFLAAAQIMSHYFQVLDFAMDRGEVPAEHRAFYDRPVDAATIPAFTQHSDIALWAGRIQNGEASREEANTVEHPYIEMAMPSASQVTAKATAFASLQPLQDEAQSVASDQQRDVADKRAEVDALILSMWNTVEFRLTEQGLSASALRAEARLWGVVYIPRAGEEPEPEPPTP